jgi:hypothetical protein
MLLALTIDQYNNDYIHIYEPTKNNIINKGFFYRITYSSNLFILNGLYFIVNINYNYMEKYYNKYKCVFDPNQCRKVIEDLRTIEYNILQKINIPSKECVLKINEQLNNGVIKLFTENNTNNNTKLFILKIAGIWETDYQYGVTFKFTKL